MWLKLLEIGLVVMSLKPTPYRPRYFSKFQCFLVQRPLPTAVWWGKKL